MTRIPTQDRDIIEQAIYLPMVLTVLERDKKVFSASPFKFKDPYLKLVEDVMGIVHKDLADAKRYMYQNKIKVERLKSDEAFTMYIFVYKGYQEEHNYFNPRLRNRTEELLLLYLARQRVIEFS